MGSGAFIREANWSHSQMVMVRAWGLSTVPISMVGATDVNDPLGWFTSKSVYFYALFILTVVVSRALIRVDSGSDSAPAG